MDRWLRNTNVVKVVALVLSILLWAVVHLENKTITGGGTTPLDKVDKIYSVSITPLYDANQYYIKSIEPAEVNIELRGSESALKKVNTSKYRIELDLSNATTGTHSLPLKPVGFPAGVDVTIIPYTVRITLEEKQKKEIPVEIQIIGTPSEGFKAGTPIVNPSRVHITVPSSRINDIDAAKAEININDAKEAVKKQIKLVVYDKNGNIVEGVITPAVVDVEVPITLPFKTMPMQMGIVGNTPEGFSVASITVNLSEVTVYGPQQELDRMDFYKGPQIQLDGLTQDQSLPLNIPLVEGVARVDPDKVNVEIHVVPSGTKILEAVPLTIFGQNNQYETKVIAPDAGQTNLALEGAPELLNRLKLQDVQALVDVSNLPPGQHEVKINFNLPNFIKLKPEQILIATVEISAKSEDGEATNGSVTTPGITTTPEGTSAPGNTTTP